MSLLDVLSDAKSIARDIPASGWQTLDVNYEEPRVERLWMQMGNYRIYLHVIHKCARGIRGLYHPHPWASAVEILAGSYWMDLGREVYGMPMPTARLLLTTGSKYEMPTPDGWHRVEPVTPVVLSVMVTGDRFTRSIPASTVPKYSLGPLREGRAEEIIEMFRSVL